MEANSRPFFGGSKEMKFVFSTILLCLLADNCLAQCADHREGKPHGNNRYLAITFVDWLQQTPLIPPEWRVSELFNLDKKRDYSNLFGKRKKDPTMADHVPYGNYRLTIDYGGKAISTNLSVCQWEESAEVTNRFARVHIVGVLADSKSVTLEGTNDPTLKVARFKHQSDDTDFADHFQKGEGDHIPYGSYRLELLQGIGVDIRDVDVFQDDVWVYSGTLGSLGDSNFSGPGGVVSGEVLNIPDAEKPLFVTLSGLYTPFMINSQVTELAGGRGSFQFVGDNQMGDYVLYTVGRSGVLDARTFNMADLLNDLRITVDLAHASPLKVITSENSTKDGAAAGPVHP
jgi:hypothetical protein